MSLPTEPDFAQIKLGNGADPEVFTVICDVTQVNINEGAETTTRYRRDCALPGRPAKRRSRVVGTFWDITGTGLSDTGQTALLRAVLGVRNNYEIPVYQDDGTDAGVLLGTYSGEAILTARNISTDRAGEASMELTLEGQDTLTFTAA